MDATAVYNHGVALMHEKKYAEALVDFQKAVEAKPNFAEAHNNLAYCLRHQGPAKYAEALSHYDKAIRLNPNLAEAYEYRGVLYFKMNRKGDAEKDLDKLKQLDPKLAGKLDTPSKITARKKTATRKKGRKEMRAQREKKGTEEMILPRRHREHGVTEKIGNFGWFFLFRSNKKNSL